MNLWSAGPSFGGTLLFISNNFSYKPRFDLCESHAWLVGLLVIQG